MANITDELINNVSSMKVIKMGPVDYHILFQDLSSFFGKR